MTWLLWAVVAIAAGYQIVSIAACLRHLFQRDPWPGRFPSVSMLKPVRGMEPDFAGAIRSQAGQDYPDFEMLFGASDASDPGLAAVEQVAREFPAGRVRTLPSTTPAPNGKVGVLIDLEREARGEIVLVSDSDISVPPGYLRAVVGPLVERPDVGLVTCVYRARAANTSGKFEALGVATDFAPSALVAPFVGVREFGLGSTLASRAADLRRIGGFRAIADYVADDYKLGCAVTALGLRVWLSSVVVETSLGGETWGDMWRHQVRWARTIRLSRGDGYAGLPVTFATLWALAALVAGAWKLGAALLLIRMVAALVAGVGVLRCPVTARWWPLVPLRDLFGVAIWIAGVAGSKVMWRGSRLRLDGEGRIISPPRPASSRTSPR